MTDTTDQQAVTATLWLERAEHCNPVLPTPNSPMFAAVAEEMEEYAECKVAAITRLASVSSASAEGLFDRRPQTSAIENGPEPSLRQMVRFYYGQHGQVDPDADAAAYLAAFAASPEPVPATNQAGEVATAVELLEQYAGFIRGDVKADDLERHPYLPLIEQTIAALATQPATPQEGETREPMAHLGVRYTVAGVMAEMLAVGVADDEGQLAEDWPLDCRVDVDRWQAVIRPALAATPTPPTLSEDLRETIEDVAAFAETRVQDGIEMSAVVWRLALEDVAKDLRAALARAQGQAS